MNPTKQLKFISSANYLGRLRSGELASAIC